MSNYTSKVTRATTCKFADCHGPAVGKSKYCKPHREVARQQWLKRISADKSERAEREARYADLYSRAHEAGAQAAQDVVPPTMVVTDERSKEEWVVPEGPCGFAWIKVRDIKFANWLKRQGIVERASYTGGHDIWVSGYGQSYTRKDAYAAAFAEVLRDAGIKAYAQSRLD